MNKDYSTLLVHNSPQEHPHPPHDCAEKYPRLHENHPSTTPQQFPSGPNKLHPPQKQKVQSIYFSARLMGAKKHVHLIEEAITCSQESFKMSK